ncbi:KRR1 small subunit processome component homolog [Palaemon carinicauda]|uniref:KRR1 small subunit processome component homolog n=1 Tax=Palaemon carinicauda TaxID=392227 RepID=UPI0035B641EE
MPKKEKAEEPAAGAPRPKVVTNAWALKVPEFKKGDMKHPLVEETSFRVMYPKYREKYLKSCWPLMQKKMNESGINAELDLVGGTMTVTTTRKTWDPYAIIKARDIMQLLQRSVPFEHAVRVLEEGMTHEVIKISGIVRNKERFAKRRQRLVGSNGTVLKALELLTDCYILIQGTTVAVIGPYNGVANVMDVVKQTMKNIHPVYLLKCLMIKRELAKNSKLSKEDWSRFLPKLTHRNVQTKKPKNLQTKKPYTPFPPEPAERNIDKSLAEGKYFVCQEEKGKGKKRKFEPGARRNEKRAKPYIAPEEPKYSGQQSKESGEIDLAALKNKVKKAKKNKTN